MSKKRKSDILYKVLMMAAVSLLAVTAVFVVVYVKLVKEQEAASTQFNQGEIIVSLNEIANLLNIEKPVEESGAENEAGKRVDALINQLQENEAEQDYMNSSSVIIFYILSVVAIVLVYGTIYILALRPFQKLQDFAAEIATGDLEKELTFERLNLFGEFTWAFDHMRREIKKARQCEQEAIANNKTVIATLSHDIKTPIASIKAYSEALENSMDTTPERRKRYSEVIIRKCDEVSKIINDMFLHSLHDLDKLVIKKEEVEIHEVLKSTVTAMAGNKDDIVLLDVKTAVLPQADAGRIAQVIENLVNNARKYAPGKLEISTEVSDEKYQICFRDYGTGILPEDMPFIFDKFYRGKNQGNESGAGLGLFIVKYVMEQMDGKAEAVNLPDGLEMRLTFSMKNANKMKS